MILDREIRKPRIRFGEPKLPGRPPGINPSRKKQFFVSAIGINGKVNWIFRVVNQSYIIKFFKNEGLFDKYQEFEITEVPMTNNGPTITLVLDDYRKF